MSTEDAMDERARLSLLRRIEPTSVGVEAMPGEYKDPAHKWVGGSTNGERRFLDDTEQALLDQLDVQVSTRDTLLAELSEAIDERQRALRAVDEAKRRVREAEQIARGTREGFEVLAKRNVPRPDRWAK